MLLAITVVWQNSGKLKSCSFISATSPSLQNAKNTVKNHI